MSDSAPAASSSLRAPGFTASAASASSSSSNAAPAANIRVYVRVRPLNAKESAESSNAARCLSPHPGQSLIEFHSKPDSKSFRFDHVSPTAAELEHDSTAGQSDVFNKVGKPITDAAIKGYNGTICQSTAAQQPAANGRTREVGQHKTHLLGLFVFVCSSVAYGQTGSGSDQQQARCSEEATARLMLAFSHHFRCVRFVEKPSRSKAPTIRVPRRAAICAV